MRPAMLPGPKGWTQEQLQVLSKALSRRQKEILIQMADYRNDDEGELVMERGEVWLGLERSSVAMVYSLLHLMAIRLEPYSEVGRLERYRINETGLRLLGRTP